MEWSFFFPVALQFFLDPGRLTYRRFLELFRHVVVLLGRVISPSQDLYLHRTKQHRKTRANIHTLSGIRTHDPSNQPTKTHASDRTATVTGGMKYKTHQKENASYWASGEHKRKRILRISLFEIWGSHCGEHSVLVFWVVTQCGLIRKYQRFGGTYCLHLQSRRSEEKHKQIPLFVYLFIGDSWGRYDMHTKLESENVLVIIITGN
jgi:hypothetical protein